MRKQWHEANPTALASLKILLSQKYPTLIVYVKNSKVFIQGPIDIVKNGKLLDTFVIEIELPKNYPIDIPIARDIAGRFPRIADRHVFSEGSLCLCVPDEYWRFYTPESTIVDFIEILVEPFLVAQIYYEKNSKMPFGERSHGWEGIVEFYSEILKTTDQKIIYTFVKYLGAKQTKGHWKCYCGSGLKIRNCHYKELNKMHQKISFKIAKKSIKYAPNELVNGF